MLTPFSHVRCQLVRRLFRGLHPLDDRLGPILHPLLVVQQDRQVLVGPAEPAGGVRPVPGLHSHAPQVHVDPGLPIAFIVPVSKVRLPVRRLVGVRVDQFHDFLAPLHPLLQIAVVGVLLDQRRQRLLDLRLSQVADLVLRLMRLDRLLQHELVELGVPVVQVLDVAGGDLLLVVVEPAASGRHGQQEQCDSKHLKKAQRHGRPH
jgi:hypothetical protein